MRSSGSSSSPSWSSFGAANLAATHQPWARIQQADAGRARATRTTRRTTGSWSRPSRATLPAQLVDQLAHAGRMVIPVAGWMTLVVMPGPVVTEHGAYRFVPLR